MGRPERRATSMGAPRDPRRAGRARRRNEPGVRGGLDGMIDLGVAYFDARAPRHTLPDLNDMAACGCSYVVHTFSEFDQLWQADSVRRLVHETKVRGMDAWIDPWSVGE